MGPTTRSTFGAAGLAQPSGMVAYSGHDHAAQDVEPPLTPAAQQVEEQLDQSQATNPSHSSRRNGQRNEATKRSLSAKIRRQEHVERERMNKKMAGLLIKED